MRINLILLFVASLLIALPLGAISSIPVSHAPSHQYHPDLTQATIQMGEFGLPSGTSWTVTVSGMAVDGTYIELSNTVTTTTTTFTSFAQSQTVSYSFAPTKSPNKVWNPSPEIGSLAVGNTAAYQNTTYTTTTGNLVTINILGGLPGAYYGTDWTGFFTNNGSVYDSIKTSAVTVSFLVPNGTYYFQVNRTYGNIWIAPSMPDGYIALFGTNYTLNEQFTMYAVNTTAYIYFQVFGLPNGTLWHVTINGTEYNSTDHWINLTLWSGNTYNYTATTANYSSIGPKVLYVNGIVFNIWITFSRLNNTSPGNAYGIFNIFGLGVNDVETLGLLIISMLAVVLLYRKTDELFIAVIPAMIIMWVGHMFLSIGLFYAVAPTIICGAGMAIAGASYVKEKRESPI